MLIHSPANGGFDSRERAYHGFQRPDNRLDYQLRPAEPLLLELKRDDLVTIVNTEGATAVWLIPYNGSARTTLELSLIHI